MRPAELETALERCPACREKIVVRGNGEVLVRNAIIRVDTGSGGVTAKCARWVEVPLRYLG